MKQEWWQKIFDERYLKTYADMFPEKLTRLQINFLIKNLRLKKGAKILDLACGHGRHSIPLAKKGFDVTGLDYSKHFIKLAREEAKKQKVDVKFVQGDRRKLSFVKKFDVVINMFSAFGYFKKESDHLLVLKKIARALKPKGKLLIDLKNPLHLICMMEGRCKRILKDRLSNGLVVVTKDEFNPATLRSRFVRTWRENGKMRHYEADVRMFTLPEIKTLMEQAGLKTEKVWGNFKGASFSLNTRQIILASK